MNNKQYRQLETLKRRQRRLEERLAGNFRGDPEPTKRELSALRWAIRVIENCDAADILKEVG